MAKDTINLTGPVKGKVEGNAHNKLKLGLLLLIVIVVVVVGGFRYYRHNGNRLIPVSYAGFTDYTMTTTTKSTGLTFKKPDNLQVTSSEPNSATLTDKSAGANTDTIMVASVPTGTDKNLKPAASALVAVGTAALNSVGPNAAKAVNSYSDDRSKVYEYMFGATSNFSTLYINRYGNSGATKTDFNYLAVDNLTSKTIGEETGEVVVVKTSKSFYYLLVKSPKSTWQSKKSNWDKVLNSLQVNR